MKTPISVLSAFIITFSILSTPAKAVEPAVFSDVSPDAWYAPYVKVCVEEGLMTGAGEGTFAPDRWVSALEGMLLAVRLDARLSEAGPTPTAPEGWATVSIQDERGLPLFTHRDYEGYRSVSSGVNGGGSLTVYLPAEAAATLEGRSAQLVIDGSTVLPGVFTVDGDKAGLTLSGLEKGQAQTITDAFYRASRMAQAPAWARDSLYYAEAHGLRLGGLYPGLYPTDRRDFLTALEEVSNPAALPVLNQVEALPDIPVDAYMISSSGGEEAYTTGNFAAFYRAGILSGVDEYGTFAGYLPLTRAECAAMLARVLRPELRLTFTLAPYPWKTPYTLTPLGLSREDWWASSTVYWNFPEVIDNELEQRILRVSRREGEDVDNDQDGILSLDGTWLVEPGRYGEIDPFQSDGLAVVSTTHYLGTAQYSVINDQGREVLPPVYRAIGHVHDGLVVAGDAETGYTVFDETGSPRGSLPPTARGDLGIREGLVLYQDDAGRWGYLDARGGVVIPAQYESAGHFYDGLAAVVLDGRAGFIDHSGAAVIPFQFDPWPDGHYSSAYRFREGAAVVTLDGKYFPIDRAGNQLSPRRYDRMEKRFTGGLAGYQYAAGSGYLDLEGVEHEEPYTGFQIMACRPPYYLALWNPGMVYTYLDADGKPLLPEWFSEASPLTADGRAIVLGRDGVYYRLELGR